MNITNNAVLITGANRGIGRALLDEAVRRGAKRVYAGTRSALQHSDNRVTPLLLDVTNSSQIQTAVEKVESLDVLINNAGIAIYDDLSKPEVIEQHLAVNPVRPPSGDSRVLAAFETVARGHSQQHFNRGACGFAGRIRLFHFKGRRAQHDSVAEGALG
jgi:NAD(P)-dependent dehydrogenase (short-subunit alcohol dehydrogenase family)